MSKQAQLKSFSVAAGTSQLTRVRRQARMLLRAARSPALVHAMPALRRLHAAAVFGASSLPALAARREQIQLKHCLRTLAVELGQPSWEALKPLIDTVPAHLIDRDQLHQLGRASLNLWFRSESQAREYLASHSDQSRQLIVVGQHAVLLEVGMAAAIR